MSTKATTAVWDHAPETLSPDEMLALIALADYADRDHWIAFPSVDKLARMIHCSIRKTQRLLRSLTEKECIAIYDRPSKASIYVVQRFGEAIPFRDKYRFNGDIFTQRKLRPSAEKPRGSFRARPVAVAEEIPMMAIDNITPIRRKKATAYPTTTPKVSTN